jgi:hypothetical protein
VELRKVVQHHVRSKQTSYRHIQKTVSVSILNPKLCFI